MKFRISVLAILVFTALIITLINFWLSYDDKSKPSSLPIAVKTSEKKKIFEAEDLEEAVPMERPALVNKDEADDDDDSDDDDDDDEEEAEVAIKTPEVAPATTQEEPVKDLSPKDVEIIKSIAKLTDADLARDMEKLMTQINKENLFEQLESGSLPNEKKPEAKQLIEKFVLLGLEKTRRKYMDTDPELKDPLVAHSQSLKEIRELLSDE